MLLFYNTPMNTSLLTQLPNHITCIGVSKNQSLQNIQKAFELGIVNFGENKVQELLRKCSPQQPWNWHFIGHLQTNKVRVLLPWVTLIHSVDSLKLVHVIEREAKRIEKPTAILLQVNLTQEPTKFGLSIEDMHHILANQIAFPHVIIKGLMVMGPTSNDEQLTKAIFDHAFTLFTAIKEKHPHCDILSMGMSDDYMWAIERGATHIRLGRNLFKE